MDYKISVVIRTYNEEKHIGEVLKSLNKQTYSNFEVIILDSQSTDNTIKIAQNYDVRIEQIEKNADCHPKRPSVPCSAVSV